MLPVRALFIYTHLMLTQRHVGLLFFLFKFNCDSIFNNSSDITNQTKINEWLPVCPCRLIGPVSGL